MIKTDQPKCFPPGVLVAVSSLSDGSVLDRTSDDLHSVEAKYNRSRFCESVDINYENVVYQQIVYGSDQTYERLAVVGPDDTNRYVSGVKSDALLTSTRQVGLFLPVADCIATVVCDREAQNLAVLHMGRHSTFTKLIAKVVREFENNGSKPEDLIVWMSPSAQKNSYCLEWFDRENDPAWHDFYEKRADGYYIDMQGYNREQFIENGVLADNIHISPVDTARDSNYYSHSQGDRGGRFALLAMMR